jgi:hypothetical protein
VTVYVDDFRMPARVGRLYANWSHLTADTKDELHAFAVDIGLRRSWFQDPMVNTKMAKMGVLPRPGSLAAESWHYDVTESKRFQAVLAGAVELPYRDFLDQVIELRRKAAREARGQ